MAFGFSDYKLVRRKNKMNSTTSVLKLDNFDTQNTDMQQESLQFMKLLIRM